MPEATLLTMRDAHDDDWPVIWPIVREVVSTGETYTYPPDIDEQTAKDIWMNPGNSRVILAIGSDKSVLGTAKISPNQSGRGSHVANASFMVAQASRGMGAGRALGQRAIELAREEGFLAMQFNAVVETNTRAVALWNALGFKIIGTVPEAFDHPTMGFVGLHIMHRKLT